MCECGAVGYIYEGVTMKYLPDIGCGRLGRARGQGLPARGAQRPCDIGVLLGGRDSWGMTSNQSFYCPASPGGRRAACRKLTPSDVSPLSVRLAAVAGHRAREHGGAVLDASAQSAPGAALLCF